MPLAIVWRNKKSISDEVAKKLCSLLRKKLPTVMNNLLPDTVSLFKEDDIAVDIREFGALAENTGELQIHIEAIDYGYYTGTPTDHRLLRNAAELIRASIAESNILPEDLVGQDQAFVWLRMMPGAFVEIR